MTFRLARPPFLQRSGGQKKQTFCKKAQWRAKKLRERGSNAGRQPRKGGGGLPIRSRFGRKASADALPIVSQGVGRCPGDCVAIGRKASADAEGKTQKKPDSLIGESGYACLYASASSSFKYACKRSKRSVRSGASMVHRDAIVRPSAYCALYLTKHAHSWAIIKAILKSD